MRSPCRLFVVGGILTLLGCSSPTAPRTIVGTYQLTAYTLGVSDLPLPYVEEASTSPSDTNKWYGGSLTLQSDSTWINIWQHAYCPGGVCGALHPDTVHGFFHFFPPGDSAGATTLLMLTWPDTTTSRGSAVIRGRRLVLYGFWVYER